MPVTFRHPASKAFCLFVLELKNPSQMMFYHPKSFLTAEIKENWKSVLLLEQQCGRVSISWWGNIQLHHIFSSFMVCLSTKWRIYAWEYICQGWIYRNYCSCSVTWSVNHGNLTLLLSISQCFPKFRSTSIVKNLCDVVVCLVLPLR